MADLYGYDPEEDYGGFGRDPLPAGDYLVVIANSEEKDTKSGNGSFLNVDFEVLEGPAKGRHIFERLNLNNPSDVAVRIAKAQLKAICEAAGVLRPKDSVELHNIPLLIGVALKKRGDTGEPQNVIKSYKPVRSAAAGQEAETASTPKAPPWKRR